jgi:Flp pilus assembly protein TadG
VASLKHSRLLRSELGAELIEMALVTPVLLLLVFSIVDFGFMFQRYVVLTNAAIEGARVASMPGYEAADARARVQAYVAASLPAGVVVPPPVVTPVNLPGPSGVPWPGMQVTVTHAYTLQYIAPLFQLIGGSTAATVNLRATSIMRRQMGS